MKICGVFVIVLLAISSQGDCRASHVLDSRALTDGTSGNAVGDFGTILLGFFNALFGGGNIAGLPDLPNILENIALTLVDPTTGFAGVKPSYILLTLLSIFTFIDIAGLPGFSSVLANIVSTLVNTNGIAGLKPTTVIVPTLFSLFTFFNVGSVLLNVLTTLFSAIFGALGGVTTV